MRPMANSSFNPHGTVFHTIEGRCLVSRVNGSWNMEMHARANAAAAPLIADLMNTGPWGSVVEIGETLVSGLEVLEFGRQYVMETKDAMRMISLAWVILPSVEGYKLLLGRYAALYEGVVPTAVFADMQSALDWSEAQVQHARKRAGLPP